MSALKAIYSPGDTMGNLEVLYKSIFEEQNYRITAHAKLLTFLTKRVGHSRGADIAKLMSVALVPSD
jgi:hypothetical protein